MSNFETERALPPIWDDGAHSPERIDWYTRLVVDFGAIKGGRAVIPEFIAAMILESSLDNLIIGNNARNGSTGANAYSLGISWVQLDTNYHVKDLNFLHTLRSDPLWALGYVADPANGLCSQGGRWTHFKKQAWHAWEPTKIDPVDGWSPLQAALDAYDRGGYDG